MWGISSDHPHNDDHQDEKADEVPELGAACFADFSFAVVNIIGRHGSPIYQPLLWWEIRNPIQANDIQLQPANKNLICKYIRRFLHLVKTSDVHE